jgi:hypothetical protein
VLLATWLAATGAAHTIKVFSRTGRLAAASPSNTPADEEEAVLGSAGVVPLLLKSPGVQVQVMAADVSMKEAAALVLQEMQGCDVLMHAAGVLQVRERWEIAVEDVK